MKNLSLSQSASASDGIEKLSKLKLIPDTHVDDLLFVQQQQAIFNDATSFSITDDLKKLSSDASRNRNRPGNECDVRKSELNQSKSSIHEKSSKDKSIEKAKQCSSAAMTIDSQPKTTTTSLAISFSSPNLATNTSFSSNSDSDGLADNACGVTARVKIQNLFDDVSSTDDNDNNEESLNLAGENDVEYAELTQRMIFPSTAQKAPTQLEAAESSESDLMIMNLFDGSSSATSVSSASTNSSNASATALLRPITSVLDIETVPIGALTSNISNSSISNNLSTEQEATAASGHSLPISLQEATCASPVWKTQVSAI